MCCREAREPGEAQKASRQAEQRDWPRGPASSQQRDAEQSGAGVAEQEMFAGAEKCQPGAKSSGASPTTKTPTPEAAINPSASARSHPLGKAGHTSMAPAEINTPCSRNEAFIRACSGEQPEVTQVNAPRSLI